MEASLDLRIEPGSAPTPKPATQRSRPWGRWLLKQIAAALLITGLAYGAFQLITHYVLQAVQVVGASMTPTLHDSERYVLNRLVYQVRDPQPREIVVLKDPDDQCYSVKRIIAREGDTVHVKNGHLYVNGKELVESYLAPGTPTYPGPKVREQLWICGVNQYFVLGDNRNNSVDSRIYGTVPRQNILGMVMQ